MRWAMRKKGTVYKTGDEGLMRDVVNNQDVDKLHQDDKEILQCARDEDPWKRERRDKRQLALSTIQGEIM